MIPLPTNIPAALPRLRTAPRTRAEPLAVLPLLKGHPRPARRLPTWIYTALLSPPPLRRWANRRAAADDSAEVRIGAVIVVLNPADPVVSSALALGVYEAGEAEMIASVSARHARTGHRGERGLLHGPAGRACGTDGHVTAFEPEPGNFGILGRTIRANGFGNVQTVQGAVSQSPGESFLFLSEQNGGDHRLYATVGRAKSPSPFFR